MVEDVPMFLVAVLSAHLERAEEARHAPASTRNAGGEPAVIEATVAEE